MPFLPGDSLLFVAGAMCATGLMSLPLTLALLWVAAVLGNQCNYAIGRAIGPRAFHWETSRWFNARAFDQAHAFYERWGGITIVAARFMPFLRTFAPFVAGVAQMTRRKFTLFDVSGGALWIGSVTAAGYLFGNIPWVKTNLDKIIWAAIFVPERSCSSEHGGHGCSVRSRLDLARCRRDGLGARAFRACTGRPGRRCWRRARHRRAALLLVDGAVADDALEHLAGGAGVVHAERGNEHQQECARGRRQLGRGASRDHCVEGAIGKASWSPTISGFMRRHRPRVLMSRPSRSLRRHAPKDRSP